MISSKKKMDWDEPHPAPNEKMQPIQWTERPTGALVAAGSLWPWTWNWILGPIYGWNWNHSNLFFGISPSAIHYLLPLKCNKGWGIYSVEMKYPGFYGPVWVRTLFYHKKRAHMVLYVFSLSTTVVPTHASLFFSSIIWPHNLFQTLK